MSQCHHLGARTCLFAECHIPVPSCGRLSRPIHMHVVSKLAVWLPVNSSLCVCHVPCARLYDDTGMAVCTSATSQHQHRAMWAGVFAHVPCPCDNMWWHRHICSHGFCVPTWACLFTCLQDPDATTWLTSSYQCLAMHAQCYYIATWVSLFTCLQYRSEDTWQCRYTFPYL